MTTDESLDATGDASTIYVTYERLAEVVVPGNSVLLDDGLIMMT
eukprot:COSAG01_NODE_66354_length_270_cov_0.906433_1_plen_43_part_01